MTHLAIDHLLRRRRWRAPTYLAMARLQRQVSWLRHSERVMSGSNVRLAILDPLPLFQAGVARALEPDGYLVEQPADVKAWSNGHDAAIVLVSLVSPAQWTLLTDLGRQRPAVASIALLNDLTVDSGIRAVRAGAVAVLPRAVTANRLRHACQAVLRGESVMPTDVVRQILHRSDRWNADQVQPDERELVWLRHLADGLTVGQTADHAGYSERMMFRLLREFYTKQGVANRTEAMLLARERGWV